ncbi:EpsG family protein [Sphingosinicella rhizophila]|uniref:EpsG family protein n=1 Tax=Sphingosinicella rhizophila TaxID=3050082 RepID=A0ABU3Q8Q0_9SPHN|nr:EpsG family protein [Sphingosinicella sp. GR2756]MDT9599697.1 EpsG family protein [Sphingosinicella sp. GR2756]
MAGLLTAVLIGLRYEVGGDWIPYMVIFDRIAYKDFWGTLAEDDPGYALINWVVIQAGLKIWAVNLICAAIFCWGTIRFAKRQPNPWLAIVVAVPYLIIVIAMGYTRQAVAIGIIFAGLASLDRQTLGRFVVYILFAASFHKSAIIVLPLVALAAARQRFATAGLLMLAGVLLYYLFVDAAIDRMMTNYVEHEMASEGAGVRVSMNLLPAAIYLLYQKRFQQTFQMSDMQVKVWRNLALGSVALLGMLFATTASTAIDRLALYFIPLQLFVWSRLPYIFTEKGRANGQLVIVIIAYSALIQFVWLNYATHAEYWLPYQTFPFGNPY